MLSFLDSPRGAGWTISWVVLRQEVFLLPLEFCSQGGTLEQPALIWTAEGQGHAGEGPGPTSQVPQGWTWVPNFSQPQSGTLLSLVSVNICKMLRRVLGT